MDRDPSLCVLSGGVGAARLLAGLDAAGFGAQTTAIVNTGDDTWIHGLRVCPDLDTITYTLAGLVNPAMGWGIAPETHSALAMLRRLGAETWFTLGDRDIGLHLYRTERLRGGERLSTITRDIVRSLGVRITLIPMTDDEVATTVLARFPDGDVRELAFQEYFVRHRHQPHVERISYAGIERATPLPAAMAALESADLVVIAPSNPFLSVFPIIALAGVADLLAARRDRVVVVTPIVHGRALKGPLADLLVDFGLEVSALAIAELYAPYAAHFVLDERDSHLSEGVRSHGLEPLLADTLIAEVPAARRLATTIVERTSRPR
jgi:LPPG:FO 2-phospho-L-lactate transferase